MLLGFNPMTLKHIFKYMAVIKLNIFVIIYKFKNFLIIKIKFEFTLVALRNYLYLIVRKININFTRSYVKID